MQFNGAYIKILLVFSSDIAASSNHIIISILAYTIIVSEFNGHFAIKI